MKQKAYQYLPGENLDLKGNPLEGRLLAVEDTHPAVGAYLPAVEGIHPVVGAHLPAVEGIHPAVGAYLPAVEENHFAFQEIHPAEGDTHPAEGDIHPAVGACLQNCIQLVLTLLNSESKKYKTLVKSRKEKGRD